MLHRCFIIAALCTITYKTVNGQTDPNYRLNSPFTPESYSIAITPYFDTGDEIAFTFDGEVSIVLKTNESNINQIKLHSEDLEFEAANITVTSANSVIALNPANPLVFDTNYTFVYINLEANLQSDMEYKVAISYRGPIRDDLNGFYRSSYEEGNRTTKWLGATQMEPTHARKVFPCFDEPLYKAKFTLAIDRPYGYKPSLSNTKLMETVPLANGYTRDIFHPTPKMSTYLVAFLVSEFEAGEYANGTKEFGIYSRPEAKNQSEFAFEFGQKVVTALGDYFGIDYYATDEFLKLDHVGLPDFRAGAMENWGLIKYREGSLLFDPEESIPTYKYRIAQIVAHETTHMWFGNLVTCHWWSNTWLNEGFANYFQDYITSLIDPEIGSANVLATGSSYDAYTADEAESPAPITNDNVNSPAEISGHFGLISYQKAGSVIKMIHHLIGDQAFRVGLNAYLTNNSLSVGYPNLMYEGLELGVASTNSLASYPGATIADIMGKWVAQPGHPILDVSVDNGVVTLSQKRFYTNSSISSDELYPIPITYATEDSPNFNDTKPAFIMENKTHVLNVTDELQEHEWVIFNIQETGFYRVNYDRHSWSLLASALRGNQRTNIHHLNRAKIVNDLFAFLKADVVQFEVLYEVLEFLKVEEDYSVWYAAVDGLNKLRNTYYGTDIMKEIDSYTLELMKNIIPKLGFTEGASDSYLTIRNRMQILYHACRIGHQECIDHSVALFKNLKDNGVPIKPSFRQVAYCNGLRYGDGDDYDFLWEKMLTTNVANEATTIQGALGCTKVEDRLRSYLQSVAEPNSVIKKQDVTAPLTSVLGDHSNADLALEIFKLNYTSFSTVFPSMSTVVTTVASALHTPSQFEEFESWLSSCDTCTEDLKESARTSLDSAKASTSWAEDHQDDIQKSLRNNAMATTPVIGVLVASYVCILNV